MNSQEQELLTRFLLQLEQTRVGTRDAEAERLIKESCDRQPDACYLLVQRSLLLEQALGNAQLEIARLQKAQDSPQSRGDGFLSGNTWGNAPNRSLPPGRAADFLAPQGAPVAARTPRWGSGILGTVASTAAGVVAGSFLFQGIESLMGHHGRSSELLAGGSTPPAHHSTTEESLAQGPDDLGASSDALDSLGPTDDDPDWV